MHNFDSLKPQTAIVSADTGYLQTHRFADGRGFPPSYIAFVTQLGWGRLCGLLLVYVPLGAYCDSWPVRSDAITLALRHFYAEMENDPLLFEPDGYVGMEQSLVPFAMSENGEYLAWDIAHRTPDNELPIYVIGSRFGSIRYGAKTLDEFVEKCMDETAVKTLFGNGYEALPHVFEPIARVE